LTGCPLRCQYCDTAYAFYEGTLTPVDAVVQRVRAFETLRVCVTGGEPLAQPACLTLLTRLCDQDFQVSLETSGAMDIGAVDSRVSRVVDIKTPGSGEVSKNRLENLPLLRSTDELKFVICSTADYRWSKEFLATHALAGVCEILFSPSYAQIKPVDLAEWILADRLPVRFQLQLHKVLWGETPGK
jgi:7-carboxy-7-deazaguanine synthase